MTDLDDLWAIWFQPNGGITLRHKPCYIDDSITYGQGYVWRLDRHGILSCFACNVVPPKDIVTKARLLGVVFND